MNPRLAQLHAYPFEKLAQLFSGITPPSHLSPIPLSIGEPKHPAPAFVRQSLIEHLNGLSQYPTTKGIAQLSEHIGAWLSARFNLNTINPSTQIIPVNGTREALFSFTQAVVDATRPHPTVVMPNPFYQIYEGATLLAGAQPYFVNCTAENGYRGDYQSVPASVWENTQLVFICTPGNPTGAVLPRQTLIDLIHLSDQYGFIIASDECYSELYSDTPPVGLLQVCAEIGRHDFKNCVVFHSLSKRSNLPGMRSGFVAGDAHILKPYLLYRTYHGAALPVQHQYASIAAWQDEQHVAENRALYQRKFEHMHQALHPYLPLQLPDAGFYFWLHVNNDEQFAQQLYAEEHITVLPGRYLSRVAHGFNPGENHVRMALVATLDDIVEASARIQRFALKHGLSNPSVTLA